MHTITAVERPRRSRRAQVYVDGEYAFEAPGQVLAEFGVAPGTTFTADAYQAVRREIGIRVAKNRAMDLLAVRSRTVKELGQRLIREEHEESIVDTVLQSLVDVGYLDDRGYASSYVRYRQDTGKSRRLLVRELVEKGVAETCATETVYGLISDEDEIETAHELIRKRAGRLSNLHSESSAKRLGGFMLRRGYPSGLVRRLVKEVTGIWVT